MTLLNISCYSPCQPCQWASRRPGDIRIFLQLLEICVANCVPVKVKWDGAWILNVLYLWKFFDLFTPSKFVIWTPVDTLIVINTYLNSLLVMSLLRSLVTLFVATKVNIWVSSWSQRLRYLVRRAMPVLLPPEATCCYWEMSERGGTICREVWLQPHNRYVGRSDYNLTTDM